MCALYNACVLLKSIFSHSMRHRLSDAYEAIRRLSDAYETSRRLSDAYGHIFNKKNLSL